ncbi:sulfite exporter TauE/SafE family protein [Bdellovibrio sp. HCB2-146]|uniref:sulfite exporter TauE/SafE family protein n=1 Tax=Bdellovibrio sp. HCB2-146 TaxID=3394362 RepID=UPI0039BD03B5
MEILGYIGAMIVGVSLGLLGGGGSILAVPLFVYLFQVPATEATTYSLFVVGFASLIGFLQAFRADRVDLKAGFAFAVPSIIGMTVVRRFILPLIPGEWIWGEFQFSKDGLILVSFAVVMVAAATAMLRSKTETFHVLSKNRLALIIKAFGVGSVTGFVGAGGGFLIVPTLVSIFGLNMRRATGTSLGVIAITSFSGFFGDVLVGRPLDFFLLGSVTALSVIGILIGIVLGKQVTDQKLKPAFGVFVLIAGAAIIFKQVML